MLNKSKDLLKPNNPQKMPTRGTNDGGSSNDGYDEVSAADAQEYFDVDATENEPEENFITDAELTLSKENTVYDYMQLIAKFVEPDSYIQDEVLRVNFERISKLARDTIWQLLFNDPTPSTQAIEVATKLLKEVKSHASFYNPWDYNDWIPLFRDKLLQHGLIDFWRDVVVKHELGPCCARDSDYFDNPDDPEPAKFYEHAGCKAPFSNNCNVAASVDIPPLLSETTKNVAVKMPVPEKISLETPVDDFRAKIQGQIEIDPENESKFDQIFNEVQNVIWHLLFAEPTLSEENYKKAEALLPEYKSEACYFAPHAYNVWIPKVRDMLFERKYFDFWKNVIVEKKCGLCWYRDCDYFDDTEDTEPIEFYKSGDELMKKYAAGGDVGK